MRPIELPKGKAVHVNWIDSVTQTGWNYEGGGFEPEHVHSIGYVISASPKTLVLSTSISDRGGIVSALIVPWQAVDEVALIGADWDRPCPTIETS